MTATTRQNGMARKDSDKPTAAGNEEGVIAEDFWCGEFVSDRYGGHECESGGYGKRKHKWSRGYAKGDSFIIT